MTNEARQILSREDSIHKARRIVHAPEAFTKKAVRAAIAFVNSSPEATEEDRFWAEAAA
jgi:myo-inositol-1-phosphate synthase